MVALGLLVIIIISGCTLNEGLRLQATDILEMNNQNTDDSYLLGVGDRISVKFYYNEKLNDEVVIRPDGKITLQLIDEIKVSGLSTEQIDNLLTSKFAKFLDSPEISVIVEQVVSQNVYIGGEVVTPKLIPMHGQLRILDTVILAGGGLETANLKNISLIRNDGTGEPNVFSVNLNEIINGHIPDINLKPHDIVYVPKVTIAKADLLAKQYLYNWLPNNIFLNFQYNTRPSANDVRTFNPASTSN
jgi:protein involved in polysaccharide export with SLBB domain